MPKGRGSSASLLGNTNSWTALQTFAAGLLLGSDDTLAWGDAVGGGTADTILQRDAANALALRNGTAGQTLNLYETFTDASNYGRMALRWDGASAWELIAQEAGTGVVRGIIIGALDITFSRAGVANDWKLQAAAGDFSPVADNARDLGTTALRIQSVYTGTSYNLRGANAQNMALKQLTELTTIAAAATTTTTIQIPANSLVLGVTARVTVIIPTAATFDIGVAGATTRYGTGVLVAAGTTNASPGTTNPTIYASAVSLTITPNLTPADNSGRVRFTIHYLDLTAPTS